MFTYLDCFKFTTILQWLNLPSQPYPLAPYGGAPDSHFLTESTCPPEISEDRPSLRARSLPSGRTTRTTRRNPSARGSQPSKSIARSAGGSRNVKPYDNTERSRELKSFNVAIWRLAKQWFVIKLWRKSCFFIKADEEDAMVDRCAIEAYEAAISEYCDNNPDGAAHISKYHLQPQSTGALVECRQVVSAIIETYIHCYSDLS